MRKIMIGDRVINNDKSTSFYRSHGKVIDRTERGLGIGFATVRVSYDNGAIRRDPVSWFIREKVRT